MNTTTTKHEKYYFDVKISRLNHKFDGFMLYVATVIKGENIHEVFQLSRNWNSSITLQFLEV